MLYTGNQNEVFFFYREPLEDWELKEATGAGLDEQTKKDNLKKLEETKETKLAILNLEGPQNTSIQEQVMYGEPFKEFVIKKGSGLEFHVTDMSKKHPAVQPFIPNPKLY